MQLNEIELFIKKFEEEGKKVFTTSSFQTHSIPLLHILSEIKSDIPVYFLNTGYHFPETIQYKEEITQKFNINVIDLFPSVQKHLQKDSSGRLFFTSNPDYCCYLNKVQLLEPILMSMDIWINGIRAVQNENRKRMDVFENSSFNTTRFHPLLDWSNKMIWDYVKEKEIPHHPLDSKGYLSIGCEPCTRKYSSANERQGRWFGMEKTECGLNTELIEKNN